MLDSEPDSLEGTDQRRLSAEQLHMLAARKVAQATLKL
jgi:hypothetical protein